MSTLQVKNLPDDLHAALAARAKEEHVTMSEFVTRTLRKELTRPSLEAWLAETAARTQHGRMLDIDSAEVVAQGRREYDSDERFD